MSKMPFLPLFWLSLTVALVRGASFARRANLVGPDNPLKSSYDFIVVGGGTSGLTVADRLTENPRSEISVLGPSGGDKMIRSLITCHTPQHRCS